MAGIVFTSETADFSANNFGNTNLSETTIKVAGITNETHKGLIRGMYKSWKEAGFFPKFKGGVLRVYGFGQLADSLNWLNPGLGADFQQATFVNDNPSFHTIAGWAPDAATLNYARSNWKVQGDFTKFHIHAFTKTAEEQGSSVNRFLAGAVANATGNNFQVALQRNGQNQIRASSGAFTGANNLVGPGNQTAGMGLLTYARDGAVGVIYDGAVPLVSRSNMTDVSATNGTSTFYEGTNSNATLQVTKTTMRALCYAHGSWTAADEATLKNILTTLDTGLSV